MKIMFNRKLLRQLRTDMDISQAELAKRSGVSTTMIAQYERGEATPRPGKIKKIAAALGINSDKLMQNENSRTSVHDMIVSELENMSEADRASVWAFILRLKESKESLAVDDAAKLINDLDKGVKNKS